MSSPATDAAQSADCVPQSACLFTHGSWNDSGSCPERRWVTRLAEGAPQLLLPIPPALELVRIDSIACSSSVLNSWPNLSLSATGASFSNA